VRADVSPGWRGQPFNKHEGHWPSSARWRVTSDLAWDECGFRGHAWGEVHAPHDEDGWASADPTPEAMDQGQAMAAAIELWLADRERRPAYRGVGLERQALTRALAMVRSETTPAEPAAPRSARAPCSAKPPRKGKRKPPPPSTPTVEPADVAALHAQATPEQLQALVSCWTRSDALVQQLVDLGLIDPLGPYDERDGEHGAYLAISPTAIGDAVQALAEAGGMVPVPVAPPPPTGRRMSFSKTLEQMRARTKTVTRREGWRDAQRGERITAVEKGMGIKAGERQVVIHDIEVLHVRRERLGDITPEDVEREGFPGWTPAQFIEFYGKPAEHPVTRIEFRHLHDKGR
jgi:hypothetical protein